MQVIFPPSAFDEPCWNIAQLEEEESIITMRKRIWELNQRLLKKGAKNKIVDPTYRYKIINE
jgi:hypothetical protein